MRVLITSRDYKPNRGGIATYLFKLASELTKQGQVLMVASASLPGDFDFDTQQDFVTKRFSVRFFWTPIWTLWILYQIIRFRPDAIVCGEWKAGIHIWLINKISRITYFTIAHGRELIDATYSKRKWIWKQLGFIKKGVLKSSAGVFPNSQYTANLLTSLDVRANHIQILHPAVDPQEFYPKIKSSNLINMHGLKNQKTILSVSRLACHKGHEVVIRALPHVLKHISNVKYLIIGQGPYQQHLEALVRQKNLEEYVVFLGDVTQGLLRDYYNLCDVFVMISREISRPIQVEGFGIVFLEANACEKPVVGGRSGGIPDAIVHGKTGFLVEPESPIQCAKTLILLLSDVGLATKMGKQGRRRIEQALNWNAVAKNFAVAIENMSP